MLVGLRRCSGLAGNLVAGHLGQSARALGDHVLQHGHDLACHPARDDAAPAEHLRAAVADVIHQVGPHPDAAVGDRRVRRGHLDRGDRDSLADRDVADRRAGPVLLRRDDPLALAGEVDPGRTSEAEARDPLGKAVLAELLGQRDRAHVGRVREDLSNGHRLRAARLGVVDDAVGDVDLVLQREARRRRDQPVRERARHRDELERRAGLVGVRDGAVALELPPDLRVVVRVEPGRYGHCAHRTGRWIEHDRSGAFGVPPPHRVPQHRLHVRLNRVVEGQVDVRAVALRP